VHFSAAIFALTLPPLRTPSQAAELQGFCVDWRLQSLSGSNFQRKR
jgi:hypothetical protein